MQAMTTALRSVAILRFPTVFSVEADLVNRMDHRQGCSLLNLASASSKVSTYDDESTVEKQSNSAQHVSSSVSTSSGRGLSAKVVPIGDTSTSSENSTDVQSSAASNSRTSSLNAAQVQNKLQEVKHAGAKLRFRIMLSTTTIGSFGICLSFIMGQLIRRQVLDAGTFGPAGLYNGFLMPFASVMVLGLQPNDVVAIRVLSLFIVICLWLFGLLTTWDGISQWFIERGIDRNWDGNETEFRCGVDLPDIGCIVWTGNLLGRGLASLTTGFVLRTNLHRVEGARFWDGTQQKGFRFKDIAFVITARQAQRRVWFWGIRWCACVGVFLIIYAIICHLLGDRAPWHTDSHFAAEMFNGIVRILLFFFWSERRFHQVLGFFYSWNAQDQAKSAACVAALLGGCNVDDSLVLAKDKFRSISFADLKEEDFSENREAEGTTNTLFDQTITASLGSCDAFISHSWRDDGKKKYAAIQEWSQEFKRKKAREPQFWLDKACVDQNDISNDLLCLPIFLAGCETLLIIAGPTYTERLWCIIEVFVFLKMGGNIERVTVIPIDWEDENDAKRMFETADASTSKCYLEADRQKLLGIVEQGFGNFDSFNNIIRRVFSERMSGTLSFEEWQSKLEEVAKASERLRFRLTMITTVSGLSGLMIVVVMSQLVQNNVLDRGVFGLESYYTSMIIPFAALMMLGVMSNDGFVIRALSLFIVIAFITLGFLNMRNAVVHWRTERFVDRSLEDDPTVFPCGIGLADSGCAAYASAFFARGMISTVMSYFIHKNIVRLPDQYFYDRSQPKGYHFNDSAFKIPARPALDRIWFWGRLWTAVVGVIFISFAIVFHSLGDDALWHTGSHFGSELWNGIVRIIFCVFTTHDRRRRVMAFLSSMNAESYVLSATCVAALLGGHNVTDSLALAEHEFRSIAVSNLFCNWAAFSELVREFNAALE